MLPTRKRSSVLACALLGLLALSGCGGKKGVMVKGTLVFPLDLKMGEGDMVQVHFEAEDKDGKSSPATYSANEKSFVANGPDAKGVLPGKYKITVQVSTYLGSMDKDSLARNARYQEFNGRFDSKNSKLSYEVTGDGPQTITINLDKGTVAKE